MILTGPEIVKQWELGKIHIHPFDPNRVGPNSYDLKLSDELCTYLLRHHGILDSRMVNAVRKTKMPAEGFVLRTGILYLASTVEEAGSEHYVPMLEGRSSLGRLGLKVHATAGFGDLGFQCRWTLEFEVTHPLRIYPGMRICQIYFHTIEGEKQLYDGKYRQSDGVEVSQSWRDFP